MPDQAGAGGHWLRNSAVVVAAIAALAAVFPSAISSLLRLDDDRCRVGREEVIDLIQKTSRFMDFIQRYSLNLSVQTNEVIARNAQDIGEMRRRVDELRKFGEGDEITVSHRKLQEIVAPSAPPLPPPLVWDVNAPEVVEYNNALRDVVSACP